jgi:hypothetical protein
MNRCWEGIFGGRPNRAKSIALCRMLRGRKHYRKLWIVESQLI